MSNDILRDVPKGFTDLHFIRLQALDQAVKAADKTDDVRDILQRAEHFEAFIADGEMPK